MITYHEDARMFVLDNGSMGNAIYVNDAGYLETVYFRQTYGGLYRRLLHARCGRVRDGALSRKKAARTSGMRTASGGLRAPGVLAACSFR